MTGALAAWAGQVREQRLELRPRDGGQRHLDALLELLHLQAAGGREALAAWRGEPTGELSELRDLGLLKLYLGADPAPLATAQLAAHRERLARYETLKAADSGSGPRGPWLVLESGIGHAREWIAFWERVAQDGARPAPRRRRPPRSSSA